MTFRPVLRVARFRADLTFSFDSANSASGTLSAEPVLKRSRAEVVVAVKSGAIVMTLRDYGKGIPETVLHNFRISGAPSGVGLGGMRGRIADMDGTLDLESPEQGALLRVTIPVAENILAAVSSSAPSPVGTQSPSGSEQSSANSSPSGPHSRDEVAQ